MLKRILKSTGAPENNNSALYLALLCLLYFFITSNYLSPSTNFENNIDTSRNIYIEISEGGISTVRSFTNPDELESLKYQYRLRDNLKSGDRLIIGNNEDVKLARISGRKSVSLGVPIGINTAGADDLKAIPGVGDELASRIINYRDSHGKFKSLDELDSVEGIGKKKLANIKKSGNLD